MDGDAQQKTDVPHSNEAAANPPPIWRTTNTVAPTMDEKLPVPAITPSNNIANAESQQNPEKKTNTTVEKYNYDPADPKEEYYGGNDNDDDDDPADRPPSAAFGRYVEKLQTSAGATFDKWKYVLQMVLYVLLILLYHAYFVAALVHNFRKAVPLIVFTAAAWTLVIYYYAYVPYVERKLQARFGPTCAYYFNKAWSLKQVKWTVYVSISLAVIIFLVVDTADNRYRLVSLVGLFMYVVLGFVFSTNPARINWRPVLWGLLSQLIIGLIILRWPPGLYAFMWLSDTIVQFLEYTYVGTSFVYGFLSEPPNICGMGPVLIFSIFQVIIFFGSVVSVLYYYGIIQWILVRIAKLMECTMETTAAESLYAAACIFLGQSEAAVLIKPYLHKLTKSEFHQLMTSGFACIAGSLFAAYISFGACPVYLLSASIMSAPASLAASKLLFPEVERSQTKYVRDLELPKGEESNVIEAISNGACSVIEIIGMIAANLIVFLALVAFMNNVVGWMGEMVGVQGLTFEIIYSYLFFPLAFLMGASDNPIWEKKVEETMVVAELIGTKTILNEFIAYKKMGDFVLQGRLSSRAQMVTTYALCGFSNIGSIGINMAIFAGLCPEKKHIIPTMALRSLIAGSVACFITASFAGLLVSTPIHCSPSVQTSNCFNVSAHI